MTKAFSRWRLWLGLLACLLTGCAGAYNGLPYQDVRPLQHWEYSWGETPAGWKPHDPPLNPPGRQGNWLWLRVRLPHLEAYDSLYLRGIDEHFEVYAKGRKIYGFGEMPPTSRYYSGFPWHMIPLQGLSGETLSFRIYSSGRHVGIFGQPRIGAPAAHLKTMLLQDLDRLAVGCLLIFIALLVFLLFVRQPVRGYRLLCLAALGTGLYVICRTEIKQLYGWSPVLWKWIEYGALFTAIPTLCLFLSRMLPWRGAKLWNGLIAVTAVTELVALLLAALGLISLQQITQPVLLLLLANMALGLGIILAGFRSVGPSGRLVAGGVLALCLFGGYEVLASLKWVPWVRPVAHWGLLLMLIAMVLALKDQVEKVYHDKRVAEESSRTKSEFLTSVSHEIRTPLNAILGFSELLSKQVAGDRQAGEYVQIIRQAGQTLLLLINDILDLSRIEAGRLEPRPRPVALRALLHELQQLFRLGMEEKGLMWDIEVGAEVPERVLLDDARLRQILLNLIGNAQKFTDQGFVNLSLSAVPTGQSLVDLCFKVSDSGIGIPAVQLERIFQAFYQVERSDRRRYGGTGLGLSISRRLADLLGGRLYASSRPGEGSSFVLEIPAVQTLEGEEHTEIAEPAPDWLESPPQAARIEIAAALRESLLRQLQELMQNKSISRIQKFADELEILASEHKEASLQASAAGLKQAVQIFDIGMINALLDQLRQGLEQSQE